MGVSLDDEILQPMNQVSFPAIRLLNLAEYFCLRILMSIGELDARARSSKITASVTCSVLWQRSKFGFRRLMGWSLIVWLQRRVRSLKFLHLFSTIEQLDHLVNIIRHQRALEEVHGLLHNNVDVDDTVWARVIYVTSLDSGIFCQSVNQKHPFCSVGGDGYVYRLQIEIFLFLLLFFLEAESRFFQEFFTHCIQRLKL